MLISWDQALWTLLRRFYANQVRGTCCDTNWGSHSLPRSARACRCLLLRVWAQGVALNEMVNQSKFHRILSNPLDPFVDGRLQTGGHRANFGGVLLGEEPAA